MVSHAEKIRVRWSDTDAGGVVNYASVLRYFEIAEWELFRRFALRPLHPRERSHRFPRVSLAVAYSRALYVDDLIEVHIRPERIGSTSITFSLEILREDTLCVQGTLTAVYVDGLDGRPISVPSEVRAALTG